MVPEPQAQSYVALPPQQFQPIGHANVVMPPPPPPPPPAPQMFHQPIPQLPARPVMTGEGPPHAQAIPVPDFQQNGPAATVPTQPQPNVQIASNYMPGFGGPRLPRSASNTVRMCTGIH